MVTSNVMPGRSGGGYTRYVVQEEEQGPGNGYVPTSYLREHPDGDPTTTTGGTTGGTGGTTGGTGGTTGSLSATPISRARGVQEVLTRETGGTGGTTGGTSGTSVGGGLRVSIPRAVDQSEYIRQMHAQALDAQQAQLRSAYEQQMADMDYQAGRIPGQYNAAADQAAVQNEINRMNFANQAANTGLNTGAYGQAALSQANALQRDLTAVRRAEADAQEQLELERQKQTAAYQQAIAQAIAQNDQQRAQALYQEALRLDEAARQRAQILAQYKYNVWATKASKKK